MVFALLGVSMPVFWLGYVLLYVFWFRLGWAPLSGIPIGTSVWQAVLQGRFILPWIVVSLTFAAFYARMVRGNLIETIPDRSVFYPSSWQGQVRTSSACHPQATLAGGGKIGLAVGKCVVLQAPPCLCIAGTPTLHLFVDKDVFEIILAHAFLRIVPVLVHVALDRHISTPPLPSPLFHTLTLTWEQAVNKTTERKRHRI